MKKLVITKLKTRGHDIEVTTRWIGHSVVVENDATINHHVSKSETFSGKVIDLH